MPKVCNQTNTEEVLDLDTNSENKIYCANCIHCKMVASPAESTTCGSADNDTIRTMIALKIYQFF